MSSFTLLIGTLVLWFLSKQALKDIAVPEVSREEPPVEKLTQNLSRVFPYESPEIADTTPSGAHDRIDIKVLGVSVGAKNFALIKAGNRTLVLEEGQEREGIKLLKVGFKEVLLSIGGREKNVEVESSPVQSVARASAPKQPISDFRISRREIDRITKDPGIMFREIRLVPYVKDGKTEGFIFEWIKPGSLFHRAGLRKGDVLISINGMTIKSGEDAFRLLQVLRNEPSLRVVVLRGGQRKEINIRIE